MTNSKNIHFQCAFSLAKINFRKHLSRKFLHFNLIRSFFWIIQKLFDTSSILTRKNLLFILKRIHHLTLSIYRTPINERQTRSISRAWCRDANKYIVLSSSPKIVGVIEKFSPTRHRETGKDSAILKHRSF